MRKLSGSTKEIVRKLFGKSPMLHRLLGRQLDDERRLLDEIAAKGEIKAVP